MIVANQPHALLDQWGCAPEAIMARNPSAVVATITCYGWSGPYAERPGAGSFASFKSARHSASASSHRPASASSEARRQR